MPKHQLQGIVVSNKMARTLVVETERWKKHRKYKRRIKIHKKYKAHYDQGEYNIGDRVVVEECRPISKEKHWRVIKKNVKN